MQYTVIKNYYYILYFFLEIKCRRPNISHPLQIDKRTLNDVYHYNHSITFICITGYSLMGKSIKHCKHNEDFQHDLPICKGIFSFMILSTVKIIIQMTCRKRMYNELFLLQIDCELKNDPSVWEKFIF